MIKIIKEGQFISVFSGITDPRNGNANRHKLIDIMVLAVGSVICGAEGWEDMEIFSKAKADYFAKFLSLEHGIPSDDTFRRVLSNLDTGEFFEAFSKWTSSIRDAFGGEVIALDGKTARRSFDRASGSSAMHMVSAWARDNRLVLGQVAVDKKSNEIKAIPELIRMIDVKGSIVTIDAMGCQKEIASKIVSQGGDYVLALKGNQPDLYDEVRTFLLDPALGGKLPTMETVDADHGRIEKRRYVQCGDLEWLTKTGAWEGMKSIGMVTATREKGETVTEETRFYISSLPVGLGRFAEGVRGHWSVENSLHWVLDMTFREDESRIRMKRGPEIFAALRRMTMNLLKLAPTKGSIKARRKKASWDHDYLTKVLFG